MQAYTCGARTRRVTAELAWGFTKMANTREGEAPPDLQAFGTVFPLPTYMPTYKDHVDPAGTCTVQQRTPISKPGVYSATRNTVGGVLNKQVTGKKDSCQED